MLLLKAVSLRKQRGDEETVVQLLKDATELHFSALHGLSYSVEYLRLLDVNFLLQIVQMLMELNQVSQFITFLFHNNMKPLS